MQLIVFTIGEKYYGFSTEKVEEITTKLSPTHLPQGPDWAAGIVNLRGQVLSLVDFNTLLNGDGLIPDLWYNNTVIIKTEENSIALMVGKVIGVTDVDENDYQYQEDDETSHVSGLISAFDKIVSVIELNNIFMEKEEV